MTFYVTHTTEFPLGGPESQVIRTIPPSIESGWMTNYYTCIYKDKVRLVSNYAISHEEVCGNGRVISSVLNLDTR